MSVAGRCLCGKVRFTAQAKREAGVCHCAQCRRISGGVFIAATCTEVTFDDEAVLGRYLSSSWGERLFCRDCGSTLGFRTLDGSMTALSIQAFDDPEAFAVTSEIFIEEKPGCYALAGDHPRLTGAEAFGSAS